MNTTNQKYHYLHCFICSHIIHQVPPNYTVSFAYYSIQFFQYYFMEQVLRHSKQSPLSTPHQHEKDNQSNIHESEGVSQIQYKKEVKNNDGLNFTPNTDENKSSKRNHQTSTTLLQQSNSYVTFGIQKVQPLISRSSFPYFLEDEQQQDKSVKRRTQKLKIMNRVRLTEKQNMNNSNLGNCDVEKEEPPVNEYLCYDLSQQINEGLYDIKVLAEEIKTIKKTKKIEGEAKDKIKPSNKIRIKKQIKIRGSWLRSITAPQSHEPDRIVIGLR